MTVFWGLPWLGSSSRPMAAAFTEDVTSLAALGYRRVPCMAEGGGVMGKVGKALAAPMLWGLALGLGPSAVVVSPAHAGTVARKARVLARTHVGAGSLREGGGWRLWIIVQLHFAPE
jgi:hypothetical protein